MKYKTLVPNFLFRCSVLNLEIIFQIQTSKISWACGHGKQKPQSNVLPRKKKVEYRIMDGLKLGRYYILSPLIYIHSPWHIHILLMALIDKHHNCSVGVLRVVGIEICLTYLLMVVNMLDIFCVLDSLLYASSELFS